MSNNQTTMYAIRKTISESHNAQKIINSFVEKLAKEGILDFFFNPEALDALIATFRYKGILKSSFELNKYSSRHLKQNISGEFTQRFSEKLFTRNAFTLEDIESNLEKIVADFENAENALELYFWFLDYTFKITQKFSQALNSYCQANPDEFFDYSSYIAEAIPATTIEMDDGYYWATDHPRAFNNISWNQSFNLMPFDTCYNFLFKYASKTPGGKFKWEFQDSVSHIFKKLIINESFKNLTKSSERTAKSITKFVNSYYSDHKLFVHMLYIRAFVWFYIKDLNSFKILNTNNRVLTNYYSILGYLPN